jgi:[ribosomal protein S5]-alanine N-acetyltransferase
MTSTPAESTTTAPPNASSTPIPTPILTLTNCLIRQYHPSDAESAAAAANNPNIVRYLRNTFPSPYTLADAESWINLCTSQPAPVTNYCLADPVTNVVIGGIGVTRQPDVHNRSWELGYWLAEECWGRGIMTEAVKAFTNWAFETWGEECQRVFSACFDRNKGSAIVLGKAGFVFEGRQRCSVWKDGVLMDSLEFAVVRRDWERERERWKN